MAKIIPLNRTKESLDLKSIRLFNIHTGETTICCYSDSEELNSLLNEDWEVAEVQKNIQDFLSEIITKADNQNISN